jgi:hypothetical protein
VVLWRLLVASSGAAGVALAARQYDVWWTALSQLSSLAVAVAYLGLAVREPRSPWLRGALTTDLLLVSLAYLPMENGNLLEPYSILEHMVTPALVVADFALVGRNQHLVRWWHPFAWVVPPGIYLAWYVGADLDTYSALDPHRPATFAEHVGVLLALVLVGFVIYASGRRRATGLLITS